MAAAKLCCTAPLRSQSPDNTPPRPVRPFKSLANIKTHFAHNKHTPDTTVDHAQRSHRLYPADDLELRRIFVTASLPEDHPHTLRIRHRKPEVDESIIHSPSFTNKLRRQLSRKSLATNKLPKMSISKLAPRSQALLERRLETGLPGVAGGYDDDAQSLCLIGSRLASLANDSCVIVDAHSNQHAQSSEPFHRCLVATDEPRRSVSVPLASCSADSPSQPRRSLSSCMQQDFKGTLTVHLPGPTIMTADDIWQSSPVGVQINPAQVLETSNFASSQLPSPQVSSPNLSQPQLVSIKSRSTEKHKTSPEDSTTSLHLYDMQISQHLRTRSQVSEASSASGSDRQNRHTHASLNSIVLSSMGPGRCKSISSSGFAGSAGPSPWEKVLEDGSSSIYSRRPSTTLEAPLVTPTEHASKLSHETVQGQSMAPDTFKLTNQGKENTASQAERVVSVSTGISFVASGSASHLNHRESVSESSSACVSTWPGDNTTCSLPKSDSSRSLGKLSKFKEDLDDASAAPRSQKKRRSVLRILFPGFTRPKLRSTSTPLLGGRIQSFLDETYDGTGDVQEFVSVPRSSSSKPQSAQRAVSFTDDEDLMPASARSISSLAVTPSLQSRQSLVNYERSLSIVGDNRRRKSTFGGTKTEVNMNDDQGDYPERMVRRASPLLSPSRKGTEEALMEKALLQHQAEKAALLRPSNQKIETAPTLQRAPVFTSPFGFQSTSEARLTSATLEELDPLESEEPPAVRRSQSMQDLRSSEDVAAQSCQSTGKKRSTVWTMDTAITKGTKSHLRANAPPHSWSRYPSHTRERRCSSAGRHDGIICRDFAHCQTPYSVDPAICVEEITKSHKVWPRLVNAKRRDWITKSRSITFGTVLRYYSNLLTSSAARNRRSSTATGGRLEHPELEVLPPVVPVDAVSSLPSGLKDHSSRSTDHLEEVRHIKEELGVLPRHNQESRSCGVKPPSGHGPAISCLFHGSQSTHSQAVTALTSEDHAEDMSILTGTLDGNAEDKPAEPDRALSARRLSRMYQAYVQLPTSLDNTEVERNDAADGPDHAQVGPVATLPLEIDSNLSAAGLSTTPFSKPRLSSGPITRHSPSVTVVDDRKGHWRSVSLLSVDSGRSIRKSTRDLLEVVRATQAQELAKLLSRSETSITEVSSL
ncbi:hypothetical protein QM012_004775 [Aureobasidium pullulans]|uniref:Uncharacterized protein n=1 Tax=Aureobasidium pullulans TaxID=5580 RepID=A0ABR0TUW8_AURPU